MADDWLGTYNSPLPSAVKPADFSYWSRSPKWSTTEAVSLSLGADPETAEDYLRRGGDNFSRSRQPKTPFILAHERLVHLVEQNFMSALRSHRVDAQAFVEWLEKMHLPLPTELRLAMDRFGEDRIDWRSVAEEAQAALASKDARIAALETALADNAVSGSANTREKESLLKLVIGMAVRGYGYDPKAARSDKPKEISGDLVLLDIPLSDDTVRKYLKEGADLLPGDPKR